MSYCGSIGYLCVRVPNVDNVQKLLNSCYSDLDRDKEKQRFFSYPGNYGRSKYAL